MIKLLDRLIIAFLSVGVVTSAKASSCSAHNDFGDTCTIDCPEGQSATCTNGIGANKPTCVCSGTINFEAMRKRFSPVLPQAGILQDGGPSAAVVQGGGPALTSDTVLQTDVLGEINKKLSTLRPYHLSVCPRTS
jgi:hypothetical protein